MKTSARLLGTLSGLGTLSLTLACTPQRDPPPEPDHLPSASRPAAPVPARPPLGTYVRVQLAKLSTTVLKHNETCRGAEVGSTFLPCNFQNSTLLHNYFGRVERLTNLVKNNLTANYKLEMSLNPSLAPEKGAFMQVDVRAIGHVDALQFPRPTPALVLEYDSLTRFLNVKRETDISGNRMLALTRGLHLINLLGPRLDKALQSVRDIVQKSIVVEAIIEQTKVGPDLRGADATITVQFHLPNHEIALATCELILADNAIEAQSCDVVAF